MTPFFHSIEIQRAKKELRAGAGFIDFHERNTVLAQEASDYGMNFLWFTTAEIEIYRFLNRRMLSVACIL